MEAGAPLFRGPEGSGVPLKTDLERDPVPEPMGLITAAPFSGILRKNGLQMGTPKILKIAGQVFFR